MFIVYAHRGASEYAPENTLQSFHLGVQLGANGIETDVRRTKDGVLVLFHDPDLMRVCGVEGNVSDYTYQELMQFTVKNEKTDTFDRIPTLEELLKYFGWRDLTFAIEIKDPDIEADVIAMLDKYNMKEKTVITAFEFPFIKRVKEIDSTYRVGHLVSKVTDEVIFNLKSIGAEQICPIATQGQLTPEKVQEWHDMGFEVRAWGVTDIERMKRTYDCKTEGTTVNFPDLLIKYIAQQQK